MKIKASINLLLIVVIALVLAACGNDNAANAGGKKIRAAIDTAAGGSFQIRAAATNNYFTDRDLNVELSNFAYGIDTVNAVLTKQADTGLAADYALLNSLGKGDFVVVSSLTGSDEQFNSVSLSEILAVKGIDEPADIKGKKIGVAKGTVFEYHWAKYLEHYSISEDDIQYVPYSTPDEAIVGMKKGDIDVVIGSGALIEKFKSIDGVHEIDRLSSVSDLGVSSYLIVDRKFAEANPAEIGKFLEGIEQGIEYVKGNPEGTADIGYKELKIAKEDILLDLKRVNYTLGFTEEDYTHLSNMKKYLLERGILDKDFNLEEKLYLGPAKQILKNKVTY